jgi:hypothetical protein
MKHLSYTLWSYDVWGNAEDGYEVNDRCCQSREFIVDAAGDEPTDAELLAALQEQGYIKGNATLADVEFEWNDNGWEVTEATTGYPLYGLELNSD